LHYHCYTLEPLLTLCMDAKLNGYDLFHYVSPKGCSLQKAIDFLMPFATGEKVHQEFVNSRVKFDRIRSNAGQKDYQSGRLFRPEETLKTLTEYYFFNPGVLPLIQKLANNNSAYPSWEILLESVQMKKGEAKAAGSGPSKESAAPAVADKKLFVDYNIENLKKSGNITIPGNYRN